MLDAGELDGRRAHGFDARLTRFPGQDVRLLGSRAAVAVYS